MSEITTLCIPNALMSEAKELGVNCSDEARKAIQEAVTRRKIEKGIVPASQQ